MIPFVHVQRPHSEMETEISTPLWLQLVTCPSWVGSRV
jgi:hypothetical protein